MFVFRVCVSVLFRQPASLCLWGVLRRRSCLCFCCHVHVATCAPSLGGQQGDGRGPYSCPCSKMHCSLAQLCAARVSSQRFSAVSWGTQAGWCGGRRGQAGQAHGAGAGRASPGSPFMTFAPLASHSRLAYMWPQLSGRNMRLRTRHVLFVCCCQAVRKHSTRGWMRRMAPLLGCGHVAALLALFCGSVAAGNKAVPAQSSCSQPLVVPPCTCLAAHMVVCVVVVFWVSWFGSSAVGFACVLVVGATWIADLMFYSCA